MQMKPFPSDLKLILDTDDLAGLGPETRPGALTIAQLDVLLSKALPSSTTSAVRALFSAAAYLWHDHLDESHSITQGIETADGSLLHGIMHRREPDYGNAKYWFRRVGTHPSFLSLAVRASELLEKMDESELHSRLLPNKTWDPFAFVDAVEDAQEGQFRSKVERLQQIQKLEFECFFENVWNRV
jgi:hypothetical protein